jgi:hypothetical protein
MRPLLLLRPPYTRTAVLMCLCGCWSARGIIKAVASSGGATVVSLLSHRLWQRAKPTKPPHYHTR